MCIYIYIYRSGAQETRAGELGAWFRLGHSMRTSTADPPTIPWRQGGDVAASQLSLAGFQPAARPPDWLAGHADSPPAKLSPARLPRPPCTLL